MNEFPEYHAEPHPGLPEALPERETLRWQGRPDWRAMAVRAFHVRKVAGYFALLLALRVALMVGSGATLAASLPGTLGYGALATLAVGLLVLLAWLMARATVYSITDRRVVMRFGVALPVTVNLPFSQIDAARLRETGSGGGDIVLTPTAGSRLSYVVMWPHARPWRFAPVQPMLRALNDVGEPAAILADALQAHAAATPPAPQPRKPAPPAAADRPRPFPLGPLVATASFVAVAVIAVAWHQLRGPTAAPAEPAAIVAAVDLRFEDRAGGAVAVIDAASGALLDVIEPGTDNFVRATLRGLVRGRRALNAGADMPFALRQTGGGRLLLIDPVTGQTVDLWAFGATNARSFARYLNLRTATAPLPAAGDANFLTGMEPGNTNLMQQEQ